MSETNATGGLERVQGGNDAAEAPQAQERARSISVSERSTSFDRERDASSSRPRRRRKSSRGRKRRSRKSHKSSTTKEVKKIAPDHSDNEPPPPVVHLVEFVHSESLKVLETVATSEADNKENEGKPAGEQVRETSVLEAIEVRMTRLSRILADDDDSASTTSSSGYSSRRYSVASRSDRGQLSRMKIISPAVAEAIRHVVNYHYPDDIRSKNPILFEPYEVIFHHEKALEEYQQTFALENFGEHRPECVNQYAYKHIGVLLDFVRGKFGAKVAAERERHARGVATYDMLWLLLEPGSDVYIQPDEIGVLEPRILDDLEWIYSQDEPPPRYQAKTWKLGAESDGIFADFPHDHVTIRPFAGEMHIDTLPIFPCNYLRTDSEGRNAEEARRHFEERGQKFFQLRRKGCHSFNGFSAEFPRQPYNGLVMVDPVQQTVDMNEDRNDPNRPWDYLPPPPPRRRNDADVDFTTYSTIICDCPNCKATVNKLTKRARFAGYSGIDPSAVEELTTHQYFLCDDKTEAFIFKIRKWVKLEVTGFHPAKFDSNLMNELVLEGGTKEVIKQLTKNYMRRLLPSEEKVAGSMNSQSALGGNDVDDFTAWSADFIEGKGRGLIFLLHGTPGVGKTYTAECIAAHTKRPLLSLTCADLGTDPMKIETKLIRWFNIAKSWGAILLIDEADIYMEQREVQDLKRNNLVAGFLRAMEYYQGILFLTTNRVGTFDEAFVSRINVMIHYPPFTDKQRIEVWESFFSKLERERETTMRVALSTRDFVREDKKLTALEWNGREIRNAFQIAVSLAEAEGKKDERGRIIVGKEHIVSTVELSQAFKDYLKKLYGKDSEGRARVRELRHELSDLKKEGGNFI